MSVFIIFENIINAWLSGDEADGKDTDNERITTATKKVKATTRTGNTKKNFGDDIDDAFADLESDIPF